MADRTLWAEASRLRARPKVSAWLKHFQRIGMQEARCSIGEHLAELAPARELAYAHGQIRAAVQAEATRGCWIGKQPRPSVLRWVASAKRDAEPARRTFALGKTRVGPPLAASRVSQIGERGVAFALENREKYSSAQTVAGSKHSSPTGTRMCHPLYLDCDSISLSIGDLVTPRWQPTARSLRTHHKQ